MKGQKILAIILAIVMFSSTFAIAASAASYSTGTYKVATSSGINVRYGAGTGYSIVGASSNGTTFTVSKTSGSWGYTSSIRCTNGYRSGWVSLSYCSKQGSSSRATYNDVFASVKGSGYSLSQGRSSASTTFNKGAYVYVWGWLHDINSNLYKSYGAGANMTLSIYRPNGNCVFSYTYKNCDNNWIGIKVDEAGQWKIQSKITGSLTGTNTCTITVKNSTSATVNPSSVSLNYSSITLSKGATKSLNATVYPSNATNKSITWTSSDPTIASVSNGKIYANGFGSATITAKTSNGKTATCKIIVKGISIQSDYAFSTPIVGDIYYLSVKAYPYSTGKITWSSSNQNVIAINSNGKMTAKSTGTATIKAQTEDGRTASQTITIYSKNTWRTGNFDSGHTAKGYTNVKLNKNSGTAYIKVYTYDSMGFKSNGQVHVTLRDYNGKWICEFDAQSGDKLKLGNDYSQYRVYIAKKQYPNSIIGNSDDFINIGKCQAWAINCTSNCYV